METKDGCPLAPGSNLNRTFTMKPLAQMCNQERGLVLDAALSKERDETNLASSSLAETGDPNDLLGVIVSYSVKVTLLLSGMGGELVVDLPFKLNHPKPGIIFFSFKSVIYQRSKDLTKGFIQILS